MSENMVNEELDAIGDMLRGALVYFKEDNQEGHIDLTAECVLSAMDYLKQNPNASIKDACDFALNEWIK